MALPPSGLIDTASGFHRKKKMKSGFEDFEAVVVIVDGSVVELGGMGIRIERLSTS